MPESTGINQERLALGTAALRSGDYPQSRGALRTVDGFCCLGVLTEVAIANGLELTRHEDPSTGWYAYGNEHDTCVMPYEVAKWYGFGPDGRNPLLRVNGYTTPAIAVNDSLRLDFNEIADAFDATYGTKGDDSDV